MEAQRKPRRITVELPDELFRWLKATTVDRRITTQNLLVEIVRLARRHEGEIGGQAAE